MVKYFVLNLTFSMQLFFYYEKKNTFLVFTKNISWFSYGFFFLTSSGMKIVHVYSSTLDEYIRISIRIAMLLRLLVNPANRAFDKLLNILSFFLKTSHI